MTDDLIDGCAEGLGELVVVEGRGVGVVGNDKVVHSHVDRVSSHSRLHQGVSEVQCLSGQQSHLSQFDDILGTLSLNDILQFALLFLLGDGGEVVIGFGYMFRDSPSLGYDSRT